MTSAGSSDTDQSASPMNTQASVWPAESAVGMGLSRSLTYGNAAKQLRRHGLVESDS